VIEPYPEQGQIQNTVVRAPITKAPYNALHETPEPPGGQAQHKLKPLHSAAASHAASPSMMHIDHEDEYDEVASESAEDEERGVVRTLADLNRFHRKKFGYAGRDEARHIIRTLHDINARHHACYSGRRP
jgi:hypothetical protein